MILKFRPNITTKLEKKVSTLFLNFLLLKNQPKKEGIEFAFKDEKGNFIAAELSQSMKLKLAYFSIYFNQLKTKQCSIQC